MRVHTRELRALFTAFKTYLPGTHKALLLNYTRKPTFNYTQNIPLTFAIIQLSTEPKTYIFITSKTYISISLKTSLLTTSKTYPMTKFRTFLSIICKILLLPIYRTFILFTYIHHYQCTFVPISYTFTSLHPIKKA